jgi:hypothetical protein
MHRHSLLCAIVKRRSHKKLDTAVERVEPSAMGGAGITFIFGQREVVVESTTRKPHTLCFRMT